MIYSEESESAGLNLNKYKLNENLDIDQIDVKTRNVIIFLSEKLVKKELAKRLKELSESHNVIIVGRDYTVYYLLKKEEKSNNENVFLKPFNFIGTIFMSNKLPLEEDRTIRVGCNEECAKKLLDNLSLSEEDKKRILRYAKINHGPYRGYYFPSLILEGVNKHRNNELDNSLERIEEKLSPNPAFMEILRSNLPRLITESFIENFLAISRAIGSIAAQILILLLFESKEKKKFITEFLELLEAWKRLPKERKEYIAYLYDITLGLPPGEAFNFFESDKQRKELKRKIKDLEDQIERIIKELNNLRVEINQKLGKLEEKVTLQGLRLIQNEDELKKVFIQTSIPEDEEIVGLNSNRSEADKEIEKKAEEVIQLSESHKVTFIIGEPGSGKSTFLYIIDRKILDEKKNICIIEDLDKVDFISSTEGCYILFDANDKQSAENFMNRISRIYGNYSKVIVVMRDSYWKEISETYLKDKEQYQVMKWRVSETVLEEIAKVRADNSCLKSHTEKDRLIRAILDKSEAVPLYITEAIKYICNNLANRHLDYTTLTNTLPQGIKDLIKRILREEVEKDPRNIIAYRLVSMYDYVPEKLIEIALSILNIPKDHLPSYFDKSDGNYRLHSWYRDVIDEIENGTDRDIDIQDAGDLDKELQEEFLPENERLRNIFEEFIRQEAMRGIVDISRLTSLSYALLLLSISRYARKYLRENGRGVDIAYGQQVEYSKLVSVEPYYEIGEFLLTQVFPKMTEDEFKKYRILIPLIFYTSMLFPNRFSIDLREFCVTSTKNEKALDKLIYDSLNEEKPFIYYVRASAYCLKQLEIIQDKQDGRYKLLIRDYEAALKELDKVINSNPNNPIHYNNRGLVLYSQGKYNEALKEFNNAMKLNPKEATYYSNIGLVYLAKREYEKALEEFEEAVKLNNKTPYYHYNKGNALLKLSRYREALEEYIKAIELDPDTPAYHEGKGNALLMLGNYEAAIEEYNIAISQNPFNPIYHFSKGYALYLLRRFDEAIKEYNIAIRLDPNNSLYYCHKGNALRDMGNYKQAIKEYDIAIKLNPNDPAYYNEKGVTLLYWSKYNEAIKEFDKAIRLDPNISGYYYNKALVLFFSFKYQEALAVIDQAIRLNPNDPNYHYIKGFILEELGKYSEALEEYKRWEYLIKKSLN